MTTSLFSSLTLRGTELPNRVMLSPMCQYSAEDGMATDWHLVHLGSRAVGGAGVVMTEATAVTPEGRISPRDLGIWSDTHGHALEDVASFIREQGSVPAIQLAHAGRKGSKTPPQEGSEPIPESEGGWETVAPSADPYPYADGATAATRKMTVDDIEDLIDAFRAAAKRSLDAGFEIAEVHAAHGYLLHEFLSPVTNHRDDDYGGSFENRTRLVREITAAVREVWPEDNPVFVRLSATDWLPDRESWDLDQSARLAPLLADAGADLIDVSAGGIHPDQQVPDTGPGYQVPYAEHVNEATELAVGTVGKITEPEQADQIIRNGSADIAAVGREHLRNPYFSLEAAHELDEDVSWPVQYRRGRFE
ncbi:NADH:flavin oxidoreductase [Halogeometricum borinquense DSM 11551]|uniref:NADH:flavin oxidoreductase n=1 Tax=Halogeometricum borinquense (strain ATCC 700274 / DSM 11551 / JCM 10706 / KCTC 4070 / PR3) TaxID=469382 RepID=E4NQ22_HALBP|nr:NADH:flavin oxidoreductase/NADH oxidase [Halogeometricum borinquense]ADQ67767.1 NADH:flavin oxidoreductase [Halogeometricum borinquense DSM 11551]ELY23551.1 NADH:flavin oxidoreductase [Halogeometricum borinquense DSM 11551]